MASGTDTLRERIRSQFAQARNRGEFLVGAAIGAGILGQSAEQGGADFVLALNAGRFRIMGAASVACMLPIRDSNRFVQSFAPAELLSGVQQRGNRQDARRQHDAVAVEVKA